MKKKQLSFKHKLNRLDIPNTRPTLKIKNILKVDKINSPKKKYSPDYSGFIIVRLSSNLPLPSDKSNTLLAVAKELRLQNLEKILEEFDFSITRRLIHSIKPKQILELELNANKSELPPLHSLTSYWRIDAQEKADKIEKITKYLNRLKEVDLAYRELSVTDPVVNAADDPYNVNQDYLDAAPIGINARWAWNQPNGEGAGIGFVDLEQGWFPNHEDFANKSPTILYGDNRDGVGSYKGNHGIAVLGIVIADDNTVGVVGIAPSVASVQMTSHYDSGTNTALNVADAILAAIPSMNVGDSLLLEVQRNYRPTEIDDADFDAIRLAIAYGIVVIEAAGNGGANLDNYVNTLGDLTLNRSSIDFRDSGAIMVGAAKSALPHNRASFSNFGSRIDCYGWGENVVSCGYGDLDTGTGDNSSYTDSFNGTSSASPIVTGAGLILQGMYEANTGTRLSPLQMRALLSDPTTGTAQGAGIAGNIGVMPNLQAIIGTTLGIVPDIYLRDNIGDTGAIPSSGSISASPDIIVVPVSENNPQATFGQGSGTENSNTLGYQVEAGQDNYIYVRMKNRGGADANNVTATIYWSEVSTLVTPDMWNRIGTTPAVNIPQGDTLVVTDSITWDQSDIPATGHYCFVGIIDHPSDPAPPLPSPTDWNGFNNFIRNMNNVSWRNFNVVDIDPNIIEDPVEMPFIIAGAPDRARIFDLEIVQHLAKGARIWLEVPMGLAKQFFEGRRWKYEIDRKSRTVKLLLPATPRIYLPEMRLGKATKIKAKFIIKGIKENVQQGNKIAIRQLFKQEEVGRVTWQFHNRKNDKKC